VKEKTNKDVTKVKKQRRRKEKGDRDVRLNEELRYRA